MVSRLTTALIAGGAIFTGLTALTLVMSGRIEFWMNGENWSQNPGYMFGSLLFYLIGPIVLAFGLRREGKERNSREQTAT